MEQTLIPHHAVKRLDGARVLVLAPHPGDEVFGCGGAILCHVAAGDAVRVMVAAADEESRAEDVPLRQKESREAAKLLGYGAPEFWAAHDCGMIYGEKLVRRVLEAIQGAAADLVYAPSVFEAQPARRVLGMAAAEAVRRLGAGVRLALYEVGMPLSPNLLLDISALAERKQLAMGCFASQNAVQRYDLDIAALNRYRSFTLPASVTAAEAYILASAEELAGDPFQFYRTEYRRQRALGLRLDDRDAPLVSIITRSMDRPMLSDALDSIALQTYPNIEVVLVDAKGAGHRDRGEWCGRFPLRMVGTGEGLSRCRAANLGLDSARGKYLIFLDDDDWFEPDHIEKLVEAIEKNPQVKVVYSGVKCVDQENNPLPTKFAYPFDATQLVAGNYIPIHALLFSRSLLDTGCRIDESLDVYEDWDFWIQLARHTDFLFVEGFSAVYRITQQAGFGVNASHADSERATLVVYKKWHGRLDDSQITRLMQSAWLNRIKDQQLTDKDQHLEDRERANREVITEKDRVIHGVMVEKDRALHEAAAEKARAIHEMAIEKGQAILERDTKLGQERREFERCIRHQLANLGAQLAKNVELERQLSCEREVAQDLRVRLAAKDAEAMLAANRASGLESRLRVAYASRSWRITAPLRATVRLMRGEGRVDDEGIGQMPALAPVPPAPAEAVPPAPPPSPVADVIGNPEYRDYLACFRPCDDLTDEVRWAMRAQIDAMLYQPTIAVRFSLLGLSDEDFQRAFDAVRYQLYPRWELWLVDGEWAPENQKEAVREKMQDDGRIKLCLDRVGGLDEEITRSPVIEGDYLYSLDPRQPPPELAFYRLAFYLSKYNPNIGVRLKGEGEQPVTYARWLSLFDEANAGKIRALRLASTNFPARPLISIIMPVYNPPERWLRKALDSVLRQYYENWELCIADDCSTEPHVQSVLAEYCERDGRIKTIRHASNQHISATSNSALELAGGDYIALLDHDDELSADALLWVVDEINRHPDAALIYSDEDKITEGGERQEPYFKPAWNPDLFLSHNLISHLGVYRTDVVRAAGGFRLGFEGSQDWDLALRVIEKIDERQIRRIPRMLYHWRLISNSTSAGVEAKPYVVSAAMRAVSEHLERCGVAAQVSEHETIPGYLRVRYDLPATPPLVSLIILTRNGLSLLRQCVESIIDKTEYAPYEIIVVDNGSDDPDTLAYLAQLQERQVARVLRDDSPFNFSALNNRAVQEAGGSIIGLLNNDVEVITPGWLGEMVSHALRPEIGAVGARLWYPDNTLQHGGVIFVGGVANHAHRGLPPGYPGYLGRAQLIQNFTAVTAACLLLRKEVYLEVGGMNERLAVAFNDVDFCLSIRTAGYHNLWTPYAELYHHESATRGHENTPEKKARFEGEIRYMRETWGPLLDDDPAYNPNLNFYREDFSLAFPPRLLP